MPPPFWPPEQCVEAYHTLPPSDHLLRPHRLGRAARLHREDEEAAPSRAEAEVNLIHDVECAWQGRGERVRERGHEEGGGLKAVIECDAHGPVPLDDDANDRRGAMAAPWQLDHEAAAAARADGDVLAESAGGQRGRVRGGPAWGRRRRLRSCRSRCPRRQGQGDFEANEAPLSAERLRANQ